MFACVYRPRAEENAAGELISIARDFSPRFERHHNALVSIDVRGLDRLIGPPRTIVEELRRSAADRGIDVQVAIAPTRSTALVLALARPGLTIVEPGKERASLAPTPIAILEKLEDDQRRIRRARRESFTEKSANSAVSALNVFRHWGIRTLGELAALPSDDLSSRLGPHALVWQAIARGEDTHPLVPTPFDERFEAACNLEWPIEELEPLSFVLTRLLEPLSARLESRDRGAAALRLVLRLVTGEICTRCLQLPSPMRDVRTLRTLLLLDLESHPPSAAVDSVTVAIEPTPGRIVQHTLFTRAHPTPEQLSTLLARLGALMGQDRVGMPATIDSYRPGAFAMEPFPIEQHHDDRRRTRRARGEPGLQDSAISAGSRLPPGLSSSSGEARRPASAKASAVRRSFRAGGSAFSAKAAALNVVSALRRCRHPVPARAVVENERPVRITTDRRGFAGGQVLASTGPWRTSGHWWNSRNKSEVSSLKSEVFFNHDEWDVVLGDGGVYRVFRDRETDGWFIDAVFD